MRRKKMTRARTFSKLFLALILLGGQWVDVPALAADSTVSEESLEALQEFGEELRGLRTRLATGAEFEQGALEHLSRRLERMKRDIHMGSTDDVDLREKVRALQRELGVLRAGGAALQGPGREGSRQAPGIPLTVANQSAGLAPANDLCETAALLSTVPQTAIGSTLEAANDGSATCGASSLSPDVWFRFVAPTYGYYSFDTLGSTFDTVLSLHRGCPGLWSNELVCNDDGIGLRSSVSYYLDTDEEVWVRVSGAVGDTGAYAVSVGTGGSVSGLVTEAGTGAPVDTGYVSFWKEGSGYVDRIAYLQDDGSYAVAGLDPGRYSVTTETDGSLLDELYDDLPCEGEGYNFGPCDVSVGDFVEVSSAGAVTGIDFQLAEGGSIAGKITGEGTGEPLRGVLVQAWARSGTLVKEAYTSTDGTYLIEGLAAREYGVMANSYAQGNELYDDILCLEGIPNGCAADDGTAVVVQLGQETPGIDFALADYGRIRGQVTSVSSGLPLPFGYLELYSVSGNYLGYGSVDSKGAYEISGIFPGNYYLLAVNEPTHRSEIWNDVPCSSGYFSSCDLSAASQITVGLGSVVEGINFALDQRGTVSGRVSVDSTGAGLEGVEVTAYDPSGVYLRSNYTDAKGEYSIAGLLPGTIFLSAQEYEGDYSPEIYQEVPCPNPNVCDPTTGTPVTVAMNQATQGIDFTLTLGGSISGLLVDVATDGPASGLDMRVYDEQGDLVRYVYGYFSGSYRVGGLSTGNYFVATDSYYYFNEVFDDVLCFYDCDPTKGVAVPVVFGQETAGINFRLFPAENGLGGHVWDAAANQLISGVRLDVWDSAGAWVGSTQTDEDGGYFFSLDEGTYYVATNASPRFANQVYRGVECPEGAAGSGGCDPTTGTPIELFYFSASMIDANFHLGVDSIFLDGFETGDLSSWARAVGEVP